MNKGSSNGIYEFDKFILDTGTSMLYCNESEVTLPPKAVKTLAVLVQNCGAIVTKDDLIEQVWEDSIVEESNLSQYLYLLRKTLGKTPDGQSYIETLRRRGYRFTGDARLAKRPTERTVHSLSAPPVDIGVERSGNVLRVVEWPSNEPAPAVQDARAAAAAVGAGTPPLPRTSSSYFLAAALGAAGVGVLVFTISWFRPNNGSQPLAGTGDINITRLTNENYVHDATISRDGNYFAYSEPVDGTWRIWVQQTGQAGRVEIDTGGKRSICCKTFSPDGKFLYFAAGNGDGNPDLYRAPTLGGRPEKVLSNVGSWVSFSPDGNELLFLRQDHARKSISMIIAPNSGRGSERYVFGTDRGFTPLTAAWSPDGKKIVFSAAVGDGPSPLIRLYIFDLETRMISAVSNELWANSYRIEWLRDGSGFAMIGTKQGDGLSTRRDQVYLISYADGSSRRLTTDGSRHEPGSLGVTDDGAIIAVSFNRASQIWSIDAGGDSRTAVQLTTGVAEGRGGIATLPDGRIAYSVLGEEGVSLWMIAADGSDKKRLLSDSHMEMVTATSDGKYFVFRDRIGEHDQLFRMATDGGEPEPLTTDQTDTTNKSYMSVSPDGLWVVYDSSGVQDGTFVASIKKIPIDGGQPENLVEDGCRSPEYSPDGRFIACSYYDKNRIAIISASDSSLISTFEKVNYAVFEPKWSPDGRSLVYIVHRNNVCNLWKQPINGSKPEQITDFTSGQCHNFAYSRDGSRIYLARGYEARDAILIRNYK